VNSGVYFPEPKFHMKEHHYYPMQFIDMYRASQIIINNLLVVHVLLRYLHAVLICCNLKT
jgi:hypothetical protein